MKTPTLIKAPINMIAILNICFWGWVLNGSLPDQKDWWRRYQGVNLAADPDAALALHDPGSRER